MTAYDLDVGSLATMTCGVDGCGIAFAIPTIMYQQRKSDGRQFYCPNGHYICFTDNEVTKLRKELAQKQKEIERKQKEIEWAQQATSRAKAQTTLAENGRRAWKAQTAKLRNRVAKGCCPKCAATFPNLAKHMRSAHSEPGASAPTPAGPTAEGT